MSTLPLERNSNSLLNGQSINQCKPQTNNKFFFQHQELRLTYISGVASPSHTRDFHVSSPALLLPSNTLVPLAKRCLPLKSENSGIRIPVPGTLQSLPSILVTGETREGILPTLGVNKFGDGGVPLLRPASIRAVEFSLAAGAVLLWGRRESDPHLMRRVSGRTPRVDGLLVLLWKKLYGKREWPAWGSYRLRRQTGRATRESSSIWYRSEFTRRLS